MKNVFERISQILFDDDAYRAAILKSQKVARQSLSFESAARELGDWSILQ